MRAARNLGCDSRILLLRPARRGWEPLTMPSSNKPVSRALRILYLMDEIPALHAGGTERQVLQLIQLAKSSGMEVQLCVFRGSDWLTPAAAACPVHHAGIHRVLRPSGLMALLKLLFWMRRQRFDIVQTFFVEANLLGPPLAWLSRVPIVLGSRRNLNYWMSRRMAFLQSISNRFCTGLVANSEAVKRVVARTERIADSRIAVLYNGVDLSNFGANPGMREQVRRQLQVSGDEVLIGNVSNLFPVKGAGHFVDAAALVAPEFPQARFLLVGDGPLRPELESRIALANLKDRVQIAGSADDVIPYLQALDIAVLSSDSEGFSNSILEYMAAGLPCIATDVGGNREAIGAEAGLLVPPKDVSALAGALRILLADSQKRRRMAGAGRARVEQLFSLERARENLLELYRRYVEHE